MAPYKKELTEKQQLFLHYLAGEAKGKVRTAMGLAGYSEGTATIYVIKPLADEIMEIAKQLIASNSIKAAFAMEDILDNPSAIGANNALAAAKELLDRAGVIKKETPTNTIRADKVFILPAKDPIVMDNDT